MTPPDSTPENSHESQPKQGSQKPKSPTKKQRIKKLNQEVWKLLGFGLLLFALVGLYYYFKASSAKKLPIGKETKDSSQKKTPTPKKVPLGKDTLPQNQPDTAKPTPPKLPSPVKQPTPTPKNILSEELLAYRNARVQELEDDIGSISRNGDELRVVSPQLRKAYQQVIFEVEYAINETLYVSVYDSTLAHQTLKGEVPMKAQGKAYRLALPQLKKGTYYWKLTNSDKKLHSGKFYIK